MEPLRTVDLAILADLVSRHRSNRGIALRAAAREAGVSPATLSRIEAGAVHPDLDTVRLLVDWLGVPLDRVWVTKLAKKPPADKAMANTLTHIEVHLRADPNLSPDAAKALTDIVRAAYPSFAKKG
ncbi:MAG: XRE family transcriptional regulator [Deltaproteobacteria bacterium HGW-Deltaproteobacteria-20]|jgi:transcriptional regulator with XRE-family HTH domain|nr:MAG: XRE family transcriptional regulator [Deltaproteobacteria bacterium HGW-Deltaproteobacteria-20]